MKKLLSILMLVAAAGSANAMDNDQKATMAGGLPSKAGSSAPKRKLSPAEVLKALNIPFYTVCVVQQCALYQAIKDEKLPTRPTPVPQMEEVFHPATTITTVNGEEVHVEAYTSTEYVRDKNGAILMKEHEEEMPYLPEGEYQMRYFPSSFAMHPSERYGNNTAQFAVAMGDKLYHGRMTANLSETDSESTS